MTEDRHRPGAPPAATTEDFAEAARRCALGRADLARRGHAPDGTRRLRRFSSWEVARWFLPTDPAGLRRLLAARPDLPQGETAEGGQRLFTLEEVLALRHCFARETGLPQRPEGCAPRIVAVANFKGGVGKTALAANLAMAAALDGLRVLVVDLDSQGSLTSLMGGHAEDEWETAFAPIARDMAETARAAGQPLDEVLETALSIDPAAVIRPTHWPGIDLVGAQLNLYWAEFQIPVWRMRQPSWKLWDALGNFLTQAGQGHDLVILDTPPALGYLTINALAAADVLVVPVGASFLEFDSTGRFFDMLHATFASIEAGESAAAAELGLAPIRFEWDAVKVMITRYDAAQQAELAEVMAGWFGPLMARHRLETTALVGQAAESVSGIYEADPRHFNRDTYARGRATFDGAWAEIRELVVASWAAEAAEAGQEEVTHGAA